VSRVERLSREALTAWIAEYLEGGIFVSASVPERDHLKLLPLVFLPIGMGCLRELGPEGIADLGVCWARLDGRDMAPRTINGWPMFWSVNYLHREDWELARRAIVRARKLEREAVQQLLDA
jgi:hypothetical protein